MKRVLLIFLAFLIVACAFGGALELRNHREDVFICPGADYSAAQAKRDPNLRRDCFVRRRPSWVNPLAVFVAIVGLGAGVALLTAGRRSV